uniref:Succinate dehydrogenase cytochrome b560 subunit n=1 Tax=Cyanidium caldarium TaxID=2771 RepID=C560_CYACA|nr:RecName: Full=Succinate dehydrogenase cytochrome b560 subunit; AltName: Full=Succinate dehydrogenase, subunit III [Cyanidium caldarium]CAA88765.1 succinate dehydrogenase (cytochrome b560 subunit) [Cyanidium caldarium]
MFYKNRPLSPYVTIYSSQWTSISSIFHRLSGLYLVFFLFVLFCSIKFLFCFSTFWFVYKFVKTCFFFILSFFIVFIVFSMYSLFYHFFIGLRHLVWDEVILMEDNFVTMSTKLSLSLSLVLVLINCLRYFLV